MALRQYKSKLQLVRSLLPTWPSSGSSATPALRGLLPSAASSSAATTLDQSCAVARQLGFSARAFHGASNVVELPSLRGLFSDLGAVSSMLPNRRLLVAQFSPHGLMLVPKAIIPPLGMATALPAAAPDTASVISPTAVQEPTNPQQQVPMMAIGIKTWRRLKMKKHKIRKRRKARRMQVK